MEHNRYTVSLEIAKALKKAGFSQDKSQWYWKDYSIPPELIDRKDYESWTSFSQTDIGWQDVALRCSYAAPTVGELGEWLPNTVIDKSYNSHVLKMFKNATIADEHFRYVVLYVGIYGAGDSTEADARGKTWLWLKQNGHLEDSGADNKGREINKTPISKEQTMEHPNDKVSLPIAELLKDKGYPQEQSKHYWARHEGELGWAIALASEFGRADEFAAYLVMEDRKAAPTMKELAEVIGEDILLANQSVEKVLNSLELYEVDARARLWMSLKMDGKLDKGIKGREITKSTF